RGRARAPTVSAFAELYSRGPRVQNSLRSRVPPGQLHHHPSYAGSLQPFAREDRGFPAYAVRRGGSGGAQLVVRQAERADLLVEGCHLLLPGAVVGRRVRGGELRA